MKQTIGILIAQRLLLLDPAEQIWEMHAIVTLLTPRYLDFRPNYGSVSQFVQDVLVDNLYFPWPDIEISGSIYRSAVEATSPSKLITALLHGPAAA